MTTFPAPTSEVEALAEDLSWTFGEMTRYSPEAHPDHNRWSWRGDGHSKFFRQQFLDQAQKLLDLGWTRTPTTEADRIRDALTHLHHQSVTTALHNPTPTNQAKTTAYAKALRAAGPRP